MHRNVLSKGLKLVGLGHEISLTVNFYKDTDAPTM